MNKKRIEAKRKAKEEQLKALQGRKKKPCQNCGKELCVDSHPQRKLFCGTCRKLKREGRKR